MKYKERFTYEERVKALYPAKEHIEVRMEHYKKVLEDEMKPESREHYENKVKQCEQALDLFWLFMMEINPD